MDNRIYKNIMKKVGPKYIAAKYWGGNRNVELSGKTLYNKMMKAKAFVSICPVENGNILIENVRFVPVVCSRVSHYGLLALPTTGFSKTHPKIKI